MHDDDEYGETARLAALLGDDEEFARLALRNVEPWYSMPGHTPPIGVSDLERGGRSR